MFPPDQHRLLDFGRGRRLEQFGPWRLDRPSPAAECDPCASPELWSQADARFERGPGEDGQWICRRTMPQQWTIAHRLLCLELRRTPYGHLGLFPEQAVNWDWIAACLRGASPQPKVLNLFAYTGGSTLAAAAAGAQVVHVDAARNSTAWARRNAECSGLSAAPIRWIVEDAPKFVSRELRRGNRYEAVILDPPSYGHGPRGEPWQIEKHLPGLLKMCAQLTAERRRFMLLTSHTPGLHPTLLSEILADAMGRSEQARITASELSIRSVDGRLLPSGVGVRWQETPCSLTDGIEPNDPHH